MAHPAQQRWCEIVKEYHPGYFVNKRVLDVGSLDINGNNRHLFDDCEYMGLDVVPGANVHIVSIAHEYETVELFDVVLSTNALEHDMYWQKTLARMFNLLKPGGLMFFSVANSWFEHGTRMTTPSESGTSQMGKAWANYYRNLEPLDIETALNLDQFSRNNMSIFENDLRFWGIKKGAI
jgi:SAM-dependent methyltransferase